MLSEEKSYAKPKEVIGDGEEHKNHNRILTSRRGWGWGQYSGDWVRMGIKWLVWCGDGYKIFYRVIFYLRAQH